MCVRHKQIYVVLLAEIGFLAASSCTFALSAVAVVLFSFVCKKEREKRERERENGSKVHAFVSIAQLTTCYPFS